MFIKVAHLSVGEVEPRGRHPHSCRAHREATVSLHPQRPPGQLPGDLVTGPRPALQLDGCAGLGGLVWGSQGLQLGPQVSPAGMAVFKLSTNLMKTILNLYGEIR